MQLGVIGLGRLGAHMVRRMLAGGHRCVVFDPSPRVVAELSAERAYGAASVADLAKELDAPRAIWIAGPRSSVDDTIDALRPHLEPEDIIVDCADSDYVDDIYRANDLAAARIHYVDVGVSGAIGCPGQGYCLTVGGEDAIVKYLQPVLNLLAVPSDRSGPARMAAGPPARGYLHCGPAGAGHFVSMIHGGIELCMAAAYAEGFSILRAANAGRRPRGEVPEGHRLIHPEHYQYEFNLQAIADLWRHGSGVASPVLKATAQAIADGTGLQATPTGGRKAGDDWATMRAAVDEGIPIPVLSSAMYLGNGARQHPERPKDRLTGVQ